MNEIECALCGQTMYPGEASPTKIGPLCKGCFNYYLDFEQKLYKKQAKSSFFLYAIPNIITLVVGGIDGLYGIQDTDIYQYALLVVMFYSLFATFQITSGKFAFVGENAIRRKYYSGEISDNGNVSVSEHNYTLPSAGQLIRMLWNVGLFVFFLLFIPIAGTLIWIISILRYRASLGRYRKHYDRDLPLKYQKVQASFFEKFRFPLANMFINSEKHPVITIPFNGVKYRVDNYSYVVEDGILYGAFGTGDDFEGGQGMLLPNCAYFIRLYENSDDFDFATGDLYDHLYEVFTEQ